MDTPIYIGIEGARRALAEIGIELTHRQLKRAADPDANGNRKLPFFVDPIDRRLKIEKNTLLNIYAACQVEAKKKAKIKDEFNRNGLDHRL